MRMICLALILATLALQERAVVVTPRAVDATIRAYEVIGFSVQTPSTIAPAAAPGPRATPPPSLGPTVWVLSIRYVDNLGTEYVDTHNEGTGAQRLIETFIFGGVGSLRTRLLQHLSDEKKIPPARITK